MSQREGGSEGGGDSDREVRECESACICRLYVVWCSVCMCVSVCVCMCMARGCSVSVCVCPCYVRLSVCACLFVVCARICVLYVYVPTVFRVRVSLSL